MNYFELYRESDPKIVGVTHGAGQFSMNEDFYRLHPWFDYIFHDKPRQTRDWWKYWANMTQYGDNLNGLTLEKKAKHVDLMDSAGFMRGFIVSDRLKTLLGEAHLPNHRFFEASFKKKDGLVEGYWWFVYDLETGERSLDFSRSTFDLQTYEEKFGKRYVINSYQEYLQAFQETGSGLRATELVFNPTFDQELDFWGVQFLTLKKAYISERLLAKFKEAKITGYCIRVLEYPLVFL